ncbi:MAG: isochorismate synthase [Candidatus Hydrogenedentes bacterium]|nr:isochorismate synthase [Candidatus Hydrogenedentota bacterium]
MVEPLRHTRPTTRRVPSSVTPTQLPDKSALLGLIRQAFDQLPGAPCIRVEVPVPLVEARAWLAAQKAPIKTYWRDRDTGCEKAAVGAADIITGTNPPDGQAFKPVFDQLRLRLSCAHPEMRYYGGWAFDSTPADEPWDKLGAYRFVLPRFELTIKGRRAVFACNARRKDPCDAETNEIDCQFDQLAPPAPRPPALPTLIVRDDLPPRELWERLVDKALQAINRREFEKVVLARQVKLRYAAPPNVSTLLDLLAQHAKNAYLFVFQPAEGIAFLGATPERLYKNLGGYIKSEALAGTRPRGESVTADVNLGQDLMHNAKELREHAFVADRVRNVLGKICSDLRTDHALSLIRLHRCQHLVRRFEGILANGYVDADALAALHPTPAVGGHPDAPALEWLRQNEPFHRGWYAGPVGWVGHDSSEFAIAIRSGLVCHDTLTLYAGAGIVAGSVPSTEWEETESKLAAFLDVLTQNDQKTR